VLIFYRRVNTCLVATGTSVDLCITLSGGITVANKEQKKAQHAPPKSNKQKKQMQKEKKAAKSNAGSISLKKE